MHGCDVHSEINTSALLRAAKYTSHKLYVLAFSIDVIHQLCGNNLSLSFGKMRYMILLLCFFIAHSRSDEIGKMAKNGEPVMVEITMLCFKKTTKDFVQPAAGIKQFFAAVASCQVSNSLTEPLRVVVHDDTENKNIKLAGPATNPQFRAMFLMQFPNTVSYMILNPEKGHWFFTNELSGCDIFIATKDSQPNMPLIVHANADTYSRPDEQVVNLRWKGDKVDRILRDFQMYYVLKVRIHITPEQPIPGGYDGYWNEYKTAHQGRVKVYRYSIDTPVVQFIQFYGHYNNGWKFFLKGKENGVKTDIPV
jgi:hypothetical protein